MKILKLGLLFTILSFASLVSGQRFYGGLTAGFNGTQVDGDNIGGYHKLGAVFGGWVQTDLPKNLFLTMELKVSQKGSRMLPNKQNNYFKFVYRLDYIDVPVVLGYKFNNTISAYIGGSYGYLFHKSYSNNFDVTTIDDFELKDWDIELLAGIKVDFESILKRNWAKNIELDLRIQNSLLSINQYSYLAFNDWNLGDYNRLISTTLFIPINLGNN